MSDPRELTIEAGATFRRTIAWTEADKVTPIPLGTRRARMQIRSAPAGPVLLDSASGGIVLTLEPDGALGVIEVKIGATKTANLQKGFYDLDLYDPDDPDEVVRLLAGPVTLTR